MDDEPVSLSALQLSLMRALWSAGQATVAEVVQALREEIGRASCRERV